MFVQRFGNAAERHLRMETFGEERMRIKINKSVDVRKKKVIKLSKMIKQKYFQLEFFNFATRRNRGQ